MEPVYSNADPLSRAVKGGRRRRTLQEPAGFSQPQRIPADRDGAEPPGCGLTARGLAHEDQEQDYAIQTYLEGRALLLKVLLDEGVISQQIVDLLLSWNHH